MIDPRHLSNVIDVCWNSMVVADKLGRAVSFKNVDFIIPENLHRHYPLLDPRIKRTRFCLIVN